MRANSWGQNPVNKCYPGQNPFKCMPDDLMQGPAGAGTGDVDTSVEESSASGTYIEGESDGTDETKITVESEEHSVPLERFREVNTKMKDYQSKAQLAEDIMRATGMTPEQLRARLGGVKPAEQGGYIDHETRSMALEAKRDSQISRLLRTEPDATEFLDKLEEDFMEFGGKKSMFELWDRYKSAITYARSAQKRRQVTKRMAQVETPRPTETQTEPEGTMSRDKFAMLSHEDQKKMLRKLGML